MKYSHQCPLHFPTGNGLQLKEHEDVVGGISPGLIFRNSLLILLTWGFVSSKRYPTQRELLVQLAAVQASSNSLSAVYRVARWLTWVITKFPSWRQPKLVTTAFFFPRCSDNGTVPLKLQFPIVPLHSGYASGKWFTKATNDNCLSFVSHLGWATNVSDCSHL